MIGKCQTVIKDWTPEQKKKRNSIVCEYFVKNSIFFKLLNKGMPS